MNKLYTGFLETAKSACPYFKKWTYRQPMMIRPKTLQKMLFLQKALYKAIRHLVENYDRYRHLLPVSAQVDAIMTRCRETPYRVGTYRTDFIIDESNEIRLIEITCRFALNGYFTSGFINLVANQHAQAVPQVKKLDLYTGFFDYMMDYFGSFRHVCILKGKDSRNDTRYVRAVFDNAGYTVYLLEADDIAQHLDLLENAAVIGELAHDEICRLSPRALDAVIHSNLMNDLRTVFLIHDKRFFSLLGNETFLNAAMSREEGERFRSSIVLTCGWHERRDVWEQARQNKDGWIIKPRALGKGIGVRAGCFTSEADWQMLFMQNDVEDLTLQPYIQQRQFHGAVGDEERLDYIVGTLLYLDNEFFGPGLFRASSHPITNQGDDRKVGSIVTSDIDDDHLELAL